MLRRSILYLFRDTATPGERARLMWGLSYLGLECPSVRAGDYGDDIAGGSKRLIEIPPWERTPRFRARSEGPPSNYDIALHLDFDDEAALRVFEDDPAAVELAGSAAPVTVGSLTAQLDWRHDGDGPRTRRGAVRHSALHLWRDDAGEAARSEALEAAHALLSAPGVESVSTGKSLSGRVSDFDWILEIQFADEAAALGFLVGQDYAQAARTIGAATKHEWTARVTNLMRGS